MLILIRTINTFYNAYIIALIILNYNNNIYRHICGNKNTEECKNRDTYICGSHNLGYLHEEIASHFLYFI